MLLQQSEFSGQVLLHIFAWKGKINFVKCAVEARAQIDAPTFSGATPLLVAAQFGQLAAARLLLDARAAVDRAAANDGATPLHIAAWGGHVDVARLLLDAPHSRMRGPRGRCS